MSTTEAPPPKRRRPKSATRRRSSQLREVLLGDPWRKLAAFGLAIGLWAYLDSQLSSDKQLDLELRPVMRGEPSGSLNAAQLVIGVDLLRFGVVDFRDALTDEIVTDVELVCRGPRARIAALPNVSGFFVQPQLIEESERAFAEFGAEDISAPESWFSDLDLTLTPERIRVTLSPTVEEQLLVTPERIRVVPPPGQSSLAERLQLDQARYEPDATVALRGPASRIESLLAEQQTLFRFAPDAPAANATELRVLLAPDLDDPRVTYPTGLPTMIVPLRSAAVEFTLPAVPILLHEPPALRGRFITVAERVDVRIGALGRLVGRLRSMQERPRELREWIDAHCVVVASIPPGASGPDIATSSRLLIGTDFRDGQDFKLTLPPTIQYLPRD